MATKSDGAGNDGTHTAATMAEEETRFGVRFASEVRHSLNTVYPRRGNVTVSSILYYYY